MSERRSRHGEGSKASLRSKRSRPKVMDESNQTVEERRQLRRSQRALKNKVIEQQSEIADPTKPAFEKLTMENAELFTQTKFPQEAVHDAETMKLIAEAGSQQVKVVSAGAVGVNIEDFFGRVREVFGGEDSGGVDWARIGANYSMVYLSTPAGGGFMMGPLDKPAKGPRAQSKRRRLIDTETKEVQPETMESQAGNKSAKQNKDQTQKRIAKMRHHEKGDVGKKKDMFETLLNPNSFTQTVENLFDFSFFVKSGEGTLDVDKETGIPQVSFNSRQDATNADIVASKQWLMSFAPADFRELKELYDMEESNLPHRDEGAKSDYYDPLVHGTRESNRQ